MSTVYFIQCRETQKIKIGHAGDVRGRVRTIQAFSPTELIVIALTAGGREREVELHRRFSQLRSHGEWFYPGYPLLKFIRDHCRVCSPRFQIKPWQDLDRADFMARHAQEQWIESSLDYAGRPLSNDLRRYQRQVIGRVFGAWEITPNAETVADVCAQHAIDAGALEVDWIAA